MGVSQHWKMQTLMSRYTGHEWASPALMRVQRLEPGGVEGDQLLSVTLHPHSIHTVAQEGSLERIAT